MKTLITKTTLQNIENKSFTVFTEYEKNGNSYDGFSVHESLEKAEEVVKDLATKWDANFISRVDGYKVITFKEDGSKREEFIKNK